MIDTTERQLSLDNYADLLALAGVVRATGTCTACGPAAHPVRTDGLWIVHDRTGHDLSGMSLLCSRHAAEWTRSGHVSV
ncbi:hypothetical protein [Demequina silvatica]|uniref:hypothetical protein n=1 Tax=Demequina silvatica TaxID=1638988 RepID=UPI000781A63A|nr:hypothetical protein [Demequina silvatica]